MIYENSIPFLWSAMSSPNDGDKRLVRFLWSSYGRRDRAETRKGHSLLIWLLIRTGIVMNRVLWWSCLLEITLACSSPYSCREAIFLTFDIRWSCSSPIPRSPVEVVEDFGFFSTPEWWRHQLRNKKISNSTCITRMMQSTKAYN